MNKFGIGAAALAILSLSATQAFAVPVPVTDTFNGVSTQLNHSPPGWVSINGTVDTIAQGAYGINCLGNTGGCVDLDGTSNNAGIFSTTGTFDLHAGQTYELSAQISGNQRISTSDNLEFGFFGGGLAGLSDPLAHTVTTSTVNNIASNSPFTLYTLLFTPPTDTTVRAFFYNLGGADNNGLILDNASVRAVPLPAAAWLLLSGLAALGAVARRRRVANGDDTAGALAA